MPTIANRPVRRRKVVAHYSDDNPNTFTKKKQSKSVEDSRPPSPPTALLTKEPPSRKRKATKPPSPPPPPPQEDVSMAHPATIYPVFPLKELVGNNSALFSNSMIHQHHNSLLLGGGSMTQAPPSPPAWTSLDSLDKKHDPIGTITWLSIRFDDESYAIVGDGHGAVGLLHCSSGGAVRTLQVIRTTQAAQRDAQREATKQKRKVVAYPNSVVQCAWSHRTIVVLTKTELECVSADSGDSLWTIPVEAGDQRRSIQQSPAFSLRQNGLLWSTGQWGLSSIPPGSLLFWENVRHCINARKENKPIVLSLADTTNLRCLVALWEKTPERSSRSFFCVCHTNDETTELIRGNVEESSSIIVVKARQSIPSNGRNILSECTLQQFNQYLFVSGRGIRMYNATDLTFIATYGESVQIHGKMVFWSRCWWLPAPNIHESEIRISKKNCWIERSDALANCTRKDTSEHDYWLISIPHPFKGPEELQSNLYVWQRDGASVFIKAPAKGCISDVWVNPSTWSTVVVSAATGELKQLSDNMKTNFPGVMYPVGFNITYDNIEYIEDEDELDAILPDFEKPMLGLYDEDPVIAADASKSKDSKAEKALYVDVHADEDDYIGREDVFAIICRPEASRSNNDYSDPGSPKHSDRRRHLLPQLEEVKQEMVESKEEETEVKPKAAPGKRRASNLENIKQSSLDTRVRSAMQKRRFQWQDALGSSLDPSQLRHSLEEKTLAMELLFLGPDEKRQHLDGADDKYVMDDNKDELSCSACLGRMALHTCGTREGPIDYDALAREQHAQLEREEAEKIRIKTERRKLAELKRRENKKQKKLEEERRQREQQQETEMLRNATRPLTESSLGLDVVHTNYSHQQSPSLYGRDFFAFPPTLRLDGNEVEPSTSLDPTDALSALAGLADSISNHATPDVSSEVFSHIVDEGRHGFGGGSHSVANYFSPSQHQRTVPSPLLLPSSICYLPAPSLLDNGTTGEPPKKDQDSYATKSLLCACSADKMPKEVENSGDIVFHTAPGSQVPIFYSSPNGYTAKDICRHEIYAHHSDPAVETSSPLVPSVNGSSTAVPRPSGLSAIVMLSETAAQQVKMEGEPDGLIKTDLPRNGTNKILDLVNGQSVE